MHSSDLLDCCWFVEFNPICLFLRDTAYRPYPYREKNVQRTCKWNTKINVRCTDTIAKLMKCRKIPKISTRAYIFQRPFLRGLFLEGLIYGGKFAFQNRLGQPYSWKWIYRFCFVLLCIWGQFSKYKPPWGLYLEGLFNGGFFALPVWGAYIWRGLFSEFYGI